MKAKYLILSLALNGLSINDESIASAQSLVISSTTRQNEEAIVMLKSFYTSYVTAVSGSTAGLEKTDAILKKYCTVSLLNRIPKLIEKLDADPFLKAQDSDLAILKTLVITKNTKASDNSYKVSYVYDEIKTTINLSLIKQKDGLKINEVW